MDDFEWMNSLKTPKRGTTTTPRFLATGLYIDLASKPLSLIYSILQIQKFMR